MGLPLRGRKILRWATWAAIISLSVLAWAQDLSFSASVDKTTANLGEPIKLTLTLSGDTTGAKLPALHLPDGFTVVAQSQSTNFAIRGGTMERSMGLVYVLIPQRAGTFQLGPFELTRNKQTIKTAPIEVTVKKPAVPPQLKPQGERFIL